MGYPSMNTAYKQTKYNLSKCADRRKNKTVKYIVVHYTGTTASAKNNCIYFGRANRNASADYFIDTNGAIYKFNGNCANYYSWHCGDGRGKYGITNKNSIGIEVVSAGKEYTQKQKDSLRSLVRAIMSDYNVPASRVVRHYDASRKRCPAPYCGSSAKNTKWKKLYAYITSSTPQKDTTVKSSATSGFKPYKVKVTASSLNVRKGAGVRYGVSAKPVRKNDVYTIIEEKNGWGKLKSGAGWISLKYTKKI